MRHIFLSALALCATLTAWSQEKADTLLNLNNASRIIVTENPQGMNIIVEGADGNPGSQAVYTQKFKNSGQQPSVAVDPRCRLPLAYPGKSGCDCEYGSSRWEGIISGAGLGLTTVVNGPDNYDFEMAKSIQITWPMIFGLKYNFTSRSSLAVGVGVGWRNIKNTGGVELIENEQGGVGLNTDPESAPVNSRIKLFSVQFPIVFSQRLPWGMGPWKTRISFGPILNLNTHASVKNGFRDAAGNKVQVYDNSIHQRKFTVDAYLCFHVGGIDVYGQYSPMKILKGHNSPDIQPLTIGVGFGMP